MKFSLQEKFLLSIVCVEILALLILAYPNFRNGFEWDDAMSRMCHDQYLGIVRPMEYYWPRWKELSDRHH